MIYSIENAFQTITLLICVTVSLYLAIKNRNRVWVLLALFYGSWVFDDLYWLLIWLFYGEPPQLSVVGSLCWYASYIFLYLLLREIFPPKSAREKRILPWLGPVFTVAMAVFYMQWGGILTNLIYGVLMGLLSFSAIRRLLDRDQQRSGYLCIAILVMCFLEYALWTASCFWDNDSLANPYYWFDFLLTISLLFFIPATRKAVEA